MVACGPIPVADGLARYREAIEETLDREHSPVETPAHPLPRLPRRRLRQLEVESRVIGPFDFLAILGCPLSEVVAARNGSLGRVLMPSRRLAHELAVLSAGVECLPSLGVERAERLRKILASKRGDLDAHVWNAIWLDEELERFLSAGPRSLVGGADSNDGSWQLARITAAIEDRLPEEIDVAEVERAFAELRDDPAMGPVLVELDRARAELDRVAALVEAETGVSCDRQSRRLARDFRERYLPLQRKLAELDRRGGDLLTALDSLYRASSARVEPPVAMRRFAAGTLDVESPRGLWPRYRSAVRSHALAWRGILEVCDVLPQARS
jgi:hypothetical protein